MEVKEGERKEAVEEVFKSIGAVNNEYKSIVDIKEIRSLRGTVGEGQWAGGWCG